MTDRATTNTAETAGASAESVSPAVSRRLTPGRVAELLGISVRSVQKWVAEEGAPHTRTPAGRSERIRLSLPEFHAWCTEHGKSVGPLPGSVVEDAVDFSDAPADSVFGAAVPRDDDELIETLRQKVRAITAGMGGVSDPASGQKLSSTIGNLTAEIRRLEGDRDRREERAGVWMRRREAEAVLCGVARIVREHVEAMPEPLAAEVLDRVGDAGIDLPDRTAFERTVASAVRTAVARVLGAIATDIEHAGSDLRVAAA